MSISESFNTSEYISEREIIELIKNGNKDEFVYLANIYRNKIISCASSFCLNPSERDDLIQEGYIALYNAARTYDESKSRFSTYAAVCIKRRMINWIEKNVNPNLSSLSLSNLDDNELSRIGVVQDGFEDSMIAKNELYDLLDNAHLILSKSEFSVFDLYIKGFTNSEICEQLGISKKSCDNSLFRIRKKLRAAKN